MNITIDQLKNIKECIDRNCTDCQRGDCCDCNVKEARMHTDMLIAESKASEQPKTRLNLPKVRRPAKI